MVRNHVLVAMLVLVAGGAAAQSAASFSSSPAGIRGSAHFSGPPPFAMPAVTGAPYSGEQVSETIQILADGTRITRSIPARKVSRDSWGRTRSERPMFAPRPGGASDIPDAPAIVEIDDPVAGVKYILDTRNKVAHRWAVPAATPVPGRAAAAGGATFMSGGGGIAGVAAVLEGRITAPPNVTGQPLDIARPDMSRQELGIQAIEGVTVEGVRYTRTIPAGTQGNDRPITSISETWFSPELRVPILSKTTDPRMGESTHKLVNISQSEPDPTLFQPPPDYTLVDEKGDFTINWGPQAR
jgi:hypothetical protein